MAVGRSIFTKAVATGTTFTQARSRSAFSVVPRLVPEDSTIEIGTVTTLPAGSPATVTNVGTPSAAILDFGIPEGDQGDDGAVQSVVAGSNISVDNTDPANPVISSTSAVSSVNGQTGVVVLDAGDIGFTPGGSLAATDVQGAIEELRDEKQPLVTNLTTWGGVTRASGFDTWVATPSSANLRALLTDEVGTGSAYFVGGALGTPASATLTNATGLPVSTGISGLGANVATFLATPSSANLAAALTDETGSGAAVFANAPTFTGTVTFPATGTDGGFILPHGGNPSAPTNGTFWTTTTGVGVRLNGANQSMAFLGLAQTFTGVKSFSSAPLPSTNDSAALGAAATAWSDLFLATGGVLGFGNGNYTITHSTGLMTFSGNVNIGGLTASSAVATDGSKNLVSVTNTGTGNNVLAASPTLSGTPLSTTAAVDTNTTQIATTAFVIGQAGAATPLGNAPTAVVGTSTRFSRADHVHPGREVLTANRTYYVRTDGSDSNTGLVNSSGGAFLTIQKAYDVLANLDFNGKTVTIQIADGTYTAGMLLNSQWQGGGALNITGNTGTPANVIISTTSSNCFFISVPLQGIVTMSGMELRTTTSGQGILIDAAARVQYSAMRFGACAGSHILANKQSALAVPTAAYTISGGASWHWRTNGGGQIISGGGSYTVTVSGTPAFGVEFVRSAKNSGIEAAGITFSGAATGTRYLVNMNATIDTGGGGASFFPGNVAGSTATGGQYV